MGHGRADVTVDILDPKLEPFYLTNTRLPCLTCNRAKHTMGAEQWALRRRAWDRWREWHERTDGPAQLELFEAG
jgi:hypothetical protein